MSNLQNLTRSHAAIATKKKTKRNQIPEILFDDEARREFLTGFHKRKLAKAEAARKKTAEREKQERQESRREQRRMLRERAIQNAAEVEKAYGSIDPLDTLEEKDDQWSGISESPRRNKGKQKEEEYEDDEVLATVAVVEDFDPDTILHGSPPPTSKHVPVPAPPEPKKPTKAQSATKKSKSNPSRIRYETKFARKAARTKQHARRAEKAELAGGKASRKKGSKKRH